MCPKLFFEKIWKLTKKNIKIVKISKTNFVSTSNKFVLGPNSFETKYVLL